MIDGIKYNTTDFYNKKVLQKIANKVVKADVTFLVRELLQLSPKLCDAVSNRVVDPVCPYCGNPLTTIHYTNAIEKYTTLGEEEDRMCVRLLQLSGHEDNDDQFDLATREEVVTYLYGEDFYICDKCKSPYRLDAEYLDFGCETSQCVEWLMLTDDYDTKLRESGEVSLVFYDNFWGRTLKNGELIPTWQEEFIFKLAYDDELLRGQRKCPFRK